jgi:type IV secretory pathway VirB2 component (pilin)
MRKLWRKARRFKRQSRYLLVAATGLILAAPAFAQAGNSPWENAVNVLETAFTSTIARGLGLRKTRACSRR